MPGPGGGIPDEVTLQRYIFKIKYNKMLFTCKKASSTLHFNVNKPYKFTYSTPNLEVHNGELTSLRGMGNSNKCDESTSRLSITI